MRGGRKGGKEEGREKGEEARKGEMESGKGSHMCIGTCTCTLDIHLHTEVPSLSRAE